jgi:hypothetical protein
MPPSEIWSHVGLLKTDDSEENVASIFMVEEKQERECVRWVLNDAHGATSQKTALF